MRDIIATKLIRSEKIADLNAEIFYVRNLNIHRCVLVADLSGKGGVISPESIREIVTRHHRASWFRGMGFGVVLAVNSVKQAGSVFDAAVDIRNQRKGTWQWTILHSRTERVCVGYHTWTHGMTTGVFQQILRKFQADGYHVSDHKVQMDRFLTFATKWTPHGRLIRQYQEIFPANR